METSREISDNLRQLCRLILGDDCSPDEMRNRLTQSLQLINNPVFATGEFDEFKLVESIKKRLMKANKQTAALQFSQLCQKLQEKDLLKNRASVLKFLLAFNNYGKRKETTPPLFTSNFASKSTRPPSSTLGNVNNIDSVSTGDYSRNQKRPLDSGTTTSGTSSGGSGGRNANGGGVSTTTTAFNSNQMMSIDWKRNQIKTTNAAFMEKPKQLSVDPTSVSSMLNRNPIAARHAFDPDSVPTPDSILLRDVIFALQGIDGQYLRYDSKKELFHFLPTAVIGKAKRELLLRIAEIGWLHGRVRSYCEKVANDTESGRGLISQAFRSGLQDELSDFYKYLAVLQAQLDTSKNTDQGVSTPGMDVGGGGGGLSKNNGTSMTARRLQVSLSGWKQRLMSLVSIVEDCQDYRGGALLSRLYEKIDHGDPDRRQMAVKLLTISCRPLLTIIVKWIYEGFLEDPYDEFFVACNTTANDETTMWREKYSLRQEMLPSFLSDDLAKKILLAGKSLNCIRYVLKENQTLEGLDVRRQDAKEMEGTILFDVDQRVRLSNLVEYAHRETSDRLMTSMNDRFLLATHLAALKKYLLLSQGDFARQLMDLLEPELDKPTSEVYFHNLSGCLEMALRQTNAQYEPAAVLDCLDVETWNENNRDNDQVLNDESDGQSMTTTTSGWELFVLKYWTKGPIGMVVSEECSASYTRLFHFIWRLKRLSFLLTSLWHRLMSTTKFLKSYAPEIASAFLHRFQLPASEMSHFVECMQYYVLFEVLECDWHTFQTELSKGNNNLDGIILLHSTYLEKLLRKSFLIDQYSTLLDEFRTILDVIFQFHRLCTEFLDKAMQEAERRRKLETILNKGKEAKGMKLPGGAGDDKMETEKRRCVVTLIESIFRSKLGVLVDQYRSSLQQFLVSLIDQSDDELRALSLRLDFSGFYHKKESRIDTSLMYKRLIEKSIK